MNKKVFWISVGLIIVIITLFIGVIISPTNLWFAIPSVVSLIIVIFISDVAKKAAFRDEWDNEDDDDEED